MGELDMPRRCSHRNQAHAIRFCLSAAPDVAYTHNFTPDNGESVESTAVPSDNNVDTRQQVYEELLDEAINQDPSSKPKRLRLPALQILLKPKHTLVANFGVICQQVNRPMAHMMLFMTTELGATASIKGDGCGLVLRGRFKDGQIDILIKKYCRQFVKCPTCCSFKTKIKHDSSIRSYIQSCEHCQASCTLAAISQPTYQAQVGRRKK